LLLEGASSEDINAKIIPLFNEYKIKGVKYKDFKDWTLVAKMIESKSHLTTEGYKEICKIKENMRACANIEFCKLKFVLASLEENMNCPLDNT